MLPRARGLRAANFNRLTFAPGADAIGNDAVQSPVTTTDDVSGTGGAKSNLAAFFLEKGMKIAFENDFGSTFGAAVYIPATHRVGFLVAPYPFDIVVTFVAGDHNGSAIQI